MKPYLFALSFLVIVFLATPPASADQDPIPLTTLGPGQTLDLFFPNHVHPFPSRKVLQFTGEMQASGTPPTAILGIHFDYIDQAGNTVIVPLPNFFQEAVPTNFPTPTVINAGPTVLDYCPPEVSIHFENLSPGTEIQFRGIFDHTCVPIPEPSTAALLLLGCIATLGRLRQCQ